MRRPLAPCGSGSVKEHVDLRNKTMHLVGLGHDWVRGQGRLSCQPCAAVARSGDVRCWSNGPFRPQATAGHGEMNASSSAIGITPMGTKSMQVAGAAASATAAQTRVSTVQQLWNWLSSPKPQGIPVSQYHDWFGWALGKRPRTEHGSRSKSFDLQATVTALQTRLQMLRNKSERSPACFPAYLQVGHRTHVHSFRCRRGRDPMDIQILFHGGARSDTVRPCFNRLCDRSLVPSIC